MSTFSCNPCPATAAEIEPLPQAMDRPPHQRPHWSARRVLAKRRLGPPPAATGLSEIISEIHPAQSRDRPAPGGRIHSLAPGNRRPGRVSQCPVRPCPVAPGRVKTPCRRHTSKLPARPLSKPSHLKCGCRRSLQPVSERRATGLPAAAGVPERRATGADRGLPEKIISDSLPQLPADS